MTSTTSRSLFAALASLALAAAAHALSITPATVNVATGNQTSQAQIDVAIAGILGSATELYKQNVGGAEVGSLAASYTTTFNNTPADPSDATITYVGGPIVGPTAYLLVKDGNQTPAWYLYNLTNLGWNGTEVLQLTGFWPAQGAISHVSLYGTTGNGDIPGTPDSGSTVALLGLGLTLLAIARRKIA